MTENELASKVIGLGIEVHKALGPGLLERASAAKNPGTLYEAPEGALNITCSL